MGMLKINCGYCGGSWTVFHRDIHYKHAATCPHCNHKIDGQTWERQIIPAFGAMDDASRELLKDASGYGTTLFTLSYESDVIYENAKNQPQQKYTESDTDEPEGSEAAAIIDFYLKHNK